MHPKIRLFFILSLQLNCFQLLTAQKLVQVPLEFTQYALGKSGCAAAFPVELTETGVKEGSEGSVLYLSRVKSNGYTFTAAIQKLSVPMSRSRMEHQVLLQQYMEGLKQPWNIIRADGRKQTQLVNGLIEFGGISEYWTDQNGLPYAVQGWANANYYVLMSIHGKKELPDENIRNAFFYSFLFPEGVANYLSGGKKKRKKN